MSKLDEFGNMNFTDPDFEAPAPATQPQQKRTGPITGADDPRLTDGAYASDPDVLKYINDVQGYGKAGNYQGQGPVAPAGTGPKASRTPDYILALIKSGMSPQEAANKYNTDNNTTEAQYYDPSAHGGHATIGLPGQYLTDEDNWGAATQRMPEGGGAAAGGGAASGAGGAGGSSLSSFLSNWLNNSNSASTGNRNQMLTRLMSLADQYAQPVTADDPVIKANADAYHGQTARAVQNFRTRAAERAHAEGVGTGSFDASIGNAEMAAGRSEAGFTGTLMSNELASRRQNLQGTLTQASGLLSDQDRVDLQSKISAIDGLLRDQSNTTTMRGQDITGQLGNKSLDNQNGQFYDKLGSDNAFSQAQLDYLWRTLGLK